MSKKQKTKTFYMGYRSNRTGGEAINPNIQYSDHNDCFMNSTIIGFSDKRESNYDDFEHLEVPADKYSSDVLYAVVVTYSDGDTFGATYGHLCFDSIFESKEEATTRAYNIRNNVKNDSVYEPWTGYFSSLESVDIYKISFKHECSCSSKTVFEKE